MSQPEPSPRVYVQQPALVVEIGLKEIYDQLVSLNTKTEVMIGDLKDLVKQAEDHEQRLRALERNRWPMHLVTALIALLAFIASFFDFKMGSR